MEFLRSAKMKNLIFLVCCAMVVKNSWCSDGISIIGSKYIRPNRPYTVAFVNPMNNVVTLKLSLECDNSGDVFNTESTLRLSSTSGKNVQFPIPSIAPTSDCTFSAINDGGEVVVNHDVSLAIPDKTVSIFIRTDKPVYKPGDELRFRVTVVDIEMKPVTNIESIQVLIQDTHENTVRHWPFAKLNKGVFETEYQMTAEPMLGTWTITVIVDDSSIFNEKRQSFEVMEYELPKFTVKAWPTKTLLIEDRKINVNVESHYTHGQRVEGKIRVNLYLDKYSNRSSYEAIQNINGSTVVEFLLREELEVETDEDHTLVKMTVAVTDFITNEMVNITQHIPVYLKPYKISLVKPSLYYHPGALYHFKLSVKDHTGLPVKHGKMIKIFIDDEEKSAPLDVHGLASFVIPTPNEVESFAVSADFDSVTYEDIGVIEGLESSSTQYLQIQSKESIKISKQYLFTISSNEPITQFTYFVVTRGIIVDFGHIQSRNRKTYVLKLKPTEAMAPKATLVVFLVKDGQFIADYFDMEFLQATDHSALLLEHTEHGLTKQDILDDLDQYNGNGRDNALDWFDSVGLFFRSGSVEDKYDSSRSKRSPSSHSTRQQMSWNPVQKPFYMIGHLPYTIQIGEMALIQVTLNHSLSNTLTTNVTVFNKNDEFEFIEKSPNDDTQRTRTVELTPHQAKLVSFLIKPKKTGEIAIKIKAVNDFTSEGLEHMLRVTPEIQLESRLYQRNESRYFSLPDHTKETFEIKCSIPANTIPGSIKITAITDHNLIRIMPMHSGSYINIPNAFGSLYRLTLTSNIIILEYLCSDAEVMVRMNAINSLVNGNFNQLKYRGDNGAFKQSIANRSKESIFLTALVANSLLTASNYITVERAVIRDAFSWLASKQKSDGCFNEIGEVLYSPMQDSSSSVALTAFVVATIQEDQDFSQEFEPLVKKAVECLANRFDGLSSNYHRALATYALSLANHSKRVDCLADLMQYSVGDVSERYWDEGSLSVEIAGYALLSYIAQDNPLHGLPIFEWLKRQLYSSDDLDINQSTFVGLKAMRKLAEIFSASQADFTVTIQSKIHESWTIVSAYDIDRTNNFLSLTEVTLPDKYREFKFEFTGIGYGFLQLSYQYRLNIAFAKPRFNLKVELLQTSSQQVQDLKVCLNYKLHEAFERSNKALVEIHLPSGFVANDNAVRDLSPGREIKNTTRSLDGSTLYVYYNSVGSNQVCFVVTAYRQFKIAMQRPGYVYVYDTVDRDHFGVKFYEGLVLQPCEICENEDCEALNC